MLGVSLIYHHKQSINQTFFATRLANQSNRFATVLAD